MCCKLIAATMASSWISRSFPARLQRPVCARPPHSCSSRLSLQPRLHQQLPPHLQPPRPAHCSSSQGNAQGTGVGPHRHDGHREGPGSCPAGSLAHYPVAPARVHQRGLHLPAAVQLLPPHGLLLLPQLPGMAPCALRPTPRPLSHNPQPLRTTLRASITLSPAPPFQHQGAASQLQCTGDPGSRRGSQGHLQGAMGGKWGAALHDCTQCAVLPRSGAIQP